MADPRLSEIHRFPVKSCRGERVTDARVEPWGLAGDRRWMVVGPDGQALTARQVNALVLITPHLTAEGVRLEAPGLEPLGVGRPPAERQVPVTLWSSRLTAAHAGDEAAAWLSEVLGRAARLVWLDDPTRRPTSPEFSRAEDRVSLADGYPLLVTTEESLAVLDEAVRSSSPADRDPLPMTRFRPNLVLSGFDPWAEDDWRRLRIGGPDGVVLRAVKGCARCVITTIDPDTALREPEPLRSLARLRRFDGKTWFGVNLVPDLLPEQRASSPVITVGDQVEVLESVEPGAGPLRSSTV